MAPTIRFHLDEHCAHAIAAGLRHRGADATTTTDAGLLEAADEGHISFALREGRVIFTEDDGFLGLDARGVPHTGIVYCAQQSRSIGEIIAALLLLWEIHEPSEMLGRVESI